MQHPTNISLGFNLGPLIETLALPALFVGLGGIVQYANDRAATRMSLGNTALLTGQSIASMLSPSDRSNFDRFATTAVTNTDFQRPLTITVAPHNTPGADFDVSVLRDDDKSLMGFLLQASGPADADVPQILHYALDGAEPGIWEYHVVPDTLTFSDEWYHLRGRARTENAPDIGQFTARVHPDDVANVITSFTNLVQGEIENVVVEYREQHAEGHQIWIETRGRIIARDPDGKPLHIIGADTDITDQKKTQLKLDDLTHRELRWKTAVLSAEQGVWDHDHETGTYYQSSRWSQMRGYGPDENYLADFDSWIAAVHPEDLPSVRDQLNRCQTGQTDLINHTYRQRHKDGHWIWLLARGRVVRRTADGLPARTIGTETDITDVKTAEAERLELADRLNIALTASNLGRWEYDVTTGIETWDDRMLEIFGITDGQHVRPPGDWDRHLHPDEFEDLTTYAAIQLAKKHDFSYDYRVRRADGEVRHLRCRAHYCKSQDGKERYIGVNMDITDDVRRTQELEQARSKLEYDSRHDALTGLANRRLLDEVHQDLSDNHTGPVVVMHIDLDHFKQINDTLGHAAGDATLQHAARLLNDCVPEGALVARVGGDEFVVLISDLADQSQLDEIAQEIIRQMAKPFNFGANQCKFGCSIGIAVSDVVGRGDNSLIVQADLALYQAKKEGRSQYRFFHDDMRKAARLRKQSFDAISDALENGEFLCHYQPQFNAHTMRLSGVEALVRWDRPGQGLMGPDTFLDVAGELGVTAQIDALVLKLALEDMAKWKSQGFDIPSISVNVSAQRLSDPDLPRMLEETDFPPGKVTFELLESTFLDNQDAIQTANLQAIKDLGIKLEVDDFGSGHASIVSVLQIAPHRLKIDRELIAPITTSRRSCDLIKTVMGIGHMLDVEVVAEGVETAQHVSILRRLGCHYLQGYGLSPPVSAQKMSDLLATLSKTFGVLQLPED